MPKKIGYLRRGVEREREKRESEGETERYRREGVR